MSNLIKILYAEDDPDIQTITRMILETHHYIVETCDSGQEALEKVHSFKPQLILLDVMMPHMDGITAFYALQNMEDTKNTPIIFITAKVNKKEIDYYLSIGSAGVICKPFDPNSLQKEIETLYKKYQERQRG